MPRRRKPDEPSPIKRLREALRRQLFGLYRAGVRAADVVGHSLESIRDVIKRLKASREQPAARPTCWRWAYVVRWTDRDTGRVITDTRVEVDTDSPDNYQRAIAAARRLANLNAPNCLAIRGTDLSRVRMRFIRIGRPLAVPC